MHQIEAVLRQTDPDLFWNKFVGKAGEGPLRLGALPAQRRARLRLAQSEEGVDGYRGLAAGRRRQKIEINSDRWNRDSLQWFVYWMQNVPGLNNGIAYRGRPLTNWWRLIGDFDGAMRERVRLVG